MWHTYNEIIPVEKNEIMPFLAIWMSIEIIILSEVSQKYKCHDITYMFNLKT